MLLRAVLRREPLHPIAHRLLGETVFAQRTAMGMAASDPAFLALAAAMPKPDVRGLPVAEFVRAYPTLSPTRRVVVERTAAMFGSQLGRLCAVGCRHDLLGELERTTDESARANLRGRRTFDGRVWDDVRGVGGAKAATGMEALDDAATFGFDTLAHEVAHQVHYLAFTPLQKARIRSLYQRALSEGRCLDYYAASNEAEYFGQGVEAFASLAKRPGGETTHGHTRFELYAVDRAPARLHRRRGRLRSVGAAAGPRTGAGGGGGSGAALRPARRRGGGGRHDERRGRARSSAGRGRTGAACGALPLSDAGAADSCDRWRVRATEQA